MEISLPIKKIHACKKHCMLFYGTDSSLTHYRWCGTSRYKSVGRKVPNLVLTYMPIANRLQMLYMSEKMAKDMTWHADHKTVDGSMVHPSDGRAWKHFDLEDPLFAHEITLMVRTCYAPMSYVQLALLIPGRKSPGQNIYVFLRPLINELKDLYDVGISTYDAYRRQNFTMKAILLWTVSDFPAYAMFSVWSTHGKHNLDVMHIEKNVCENIFNTVMDTPKTKDNIKARMDIEKYCNRPDLHVWNQNNKVLKTKAWMYVYERKLGSLKRTVRNRARPEGSIVEAHRILSGSDPKNEHLKDLAYGPINEVTSHMGYIVNGYKFHTLAHGDDRVTNNSGVCVKGSCYNEEEIDYYGELEEVDVKYRSRGCIYDPFILAHQAQQAYYATHPSMTKDLKDWWAVVKAIPRGIFQVAEGILASKMFSNDNVDGEDFFQENERLECTIGTTEDIQPVSLVREEIEEVQTALVTDVMNEDSEEEEFEDSDDDSSDDIDFYSSNHSSDEDG
ncbi:transposon, En/Spm-like, transposase-associated domain protein [Tanacetum coccineum]